MRALVRRVVVRTVTLSAAVAAAAVFSSHAPFGPTTTAAAATGAAASIGAGGTAKGDISTDAGDEDVVSVDLVEGAPLTAKFTSKFAAVVEFAGPDGKVLDLRWGTGPKRLAKSIPVASTGRHTFRVRSADGSQGTYVLSATQKWPKKVTLSGTTGEPVAWGMPAGASLSGKIAAYPAKSWDPTVASLVGPSGPALPGEIAGAKGFAALPKLTAGQGGGWAMTVTGGTPGGAFRASLALKVPKAKPVTASLENGLTVTSFAGDGVKQLLADSCLACHAWAGSAATAKPFAKDALARAASGNMPQGAARLDAQQVDLIRKWIATGMKP